MDAIKIVGEDPKTTIFTASALVALYNKVIFDPYRHCSLLMTIVSAILTYGFLIGFTVLSFEVVTAGIEKVFQVLTVMVSFAGACLTTYSVWKKLRINRRRKNVKGKG